MMLHGLCVGEEAGARNLVFFRVKWLQPAMKGTSSVRRLRLRSFLSRIVPPMCFATSGCSCVRSSMRFLKLWWQIALEWLHDVAWALCWGGSRNTKPCVFPCKVAAAGDERYLVCAAVAAAVVSVANCSSYMCFATSGCSCVRSSMRFLKLWWQIALEWLHDVAWALCSGGSRSTKPCVFPRKVISDAIARSSIVFCNSVSADRIVVAASRLLGAAAACVILLSFAAEDRKSYWNGCIKAAKVICQQIFSILALIIFLLKFLFKSSSKSSFVALASRSIRFWSWNFRRHCT